MVPRTFLFIFHAGSRRLDSNNFWNSSYKEKTAGSASFHCVKNPFLTEQSLSQINLFPIINLFPLVEKKRLNMRKRFLQDRKPYEMTNSSKNTFPQDKKWLLHNFNNGFHQQKEYYNTKEYYFTSFCFCQWKLLLKVGRIQLLKIIFSLPMEIRGDPVFQK